MPTYDPAEQRMVVRVVYDGVACAGKTTNLRQLCALFAAQRGAHVVSPAEMLGRTLYFDYLQIAAGVVCGLPLLCQVLSVPGQVVLNPRRRHLLATADVVIYVCESHEAGIAAGRAGLELYDEIAASRSTPMPLVVQANKQDQPGAQSGAAVLAALGRSTPVVEGIASEGVGVVDTFVTAVRTVVRALQQQSEREALHVPVRRAETSDELLAKLSAERLDPEWAAEMLLEEAQAAFMLEQAMTAITIDERERRAAAAAATELERAVATRPPRAATARPEAAPVARDASASEGAPADVAPPADEDEDAYLVEDDAGFDIDDAHAPPVLPSADVPTGFIWPAHTGRATVARLGISGHASVEVEGVVTASAHGHIARTSRRARFADGESARQALVRRARECTQLDRLLVPETVLVAQAASDGACWIWTVMPELPTVQQRLATGADVTELLTAYGTAVVDALRTSLRHGFVLDFSPSSFGVEHGTLRYVGDIETATPTAAALSASMFAAVDALTSAGVDATPFLDAFESGLERRLTPEERPLGIVLSEGAPVSDHGVTPAGERLYAVLARAAAS